MANIYNYDEKAAYDQRYRSSYRHNKTTSYSSNSSTTSSTFCNDEKCDACNSNPNTRPFSYPADGKLHGETRVRFMVEKPLPPGWVANWNWDVAQKRGDGSGFGGKEAKDRKRVRREMVDEWWRNGGQGLEPYDSDEDEDADADADKEKEES